MPNGDVFLDDPPIIVASCKIGGDTDGGPVRPVQKRIKTVKVWLNCFIPRDSPPFTKPVPGRPDLTMVDPPHIPGCYLTDQRSFNPFDIHASSRMHSEITIDVTTSPTAMEVFQWHNTDETVRVNCTSGEIECHDHADRSRMSFGRVHGSASSIIEVDLKAAAHDPCTFGAGAFGDVDYDGNIQISVDDVPGERAEAFLRFTGHVELWPAFEMYATVNNGAGVFIFQEGPDPEADPWNLTGLPEREVIRGTTIAQI